MTFEEDFPSLKDRWDFKDGPVSGDEDYDRVYIQAEVRECCLDRQRVREAIDGVQFFLEADEERNRQKSEDLAEIKSLIKERLGL